MAAPLAFLAGPTASGKTELSLEVALALGAEIASMDSMQVYRGMDIGTGKPAPEERAGVPHHLLDIADPREAFSTGEWVRRAEAVAGEIRGRGRLPLFVGGTMLYLKSLGEGMFEGPPAVPGIRRRLAGEAERMGVGALHERLRAADPVSASRIHPGDLRRIVRALEVFEATGKPLSGLASQWGGRPKPGVRAVAILRERPDLDRRIGERLDRMLGRGWVEEVRGLLESGSLGPTAREALGYREIAECLEGRAPFEGLRDRIFRRTRRFARKQEMWLRSLSWVETIRVGEDALSARDRILMALEKPSLSGSDDKESPEGDSGAEGGR